MALWLLLILELIMNDIAIRLQIAEEETGQQQQQKLCGRLCGIFLFFVLNESRWNCSFSFVFNTFARLVSLDRQNVEWKWIDRREMLAQRIEQTKLNRTHRRKRTHTAGRPVHTLYCTLNHVAT